MTSKSMSFSSVNTNVTWIRRRLVALMLFQACVKKKKQKNNVPDIVMVISQEEKNASVINPNLHPCVGTTISSTGEINTVVFFFPYSSIPRPFLYK